MRSPSSMSTIMGWNDRSKISTRYSLNHHTKKEQIVYKASVSQLRNKALSRTQQPRILQEKTNSIQHSLHQHCSKIVYLLKVYSSVNHTGSAEKTKTQTNQSPRGLWVQTTVLKILGGHRLFVTAMILR